MDVPTSDLNIVRSDHKVCTSDGAVWDESRPVPALEQILLSDKTFRVVNHLHAPCHFYSLRWVHIVSLRDADAKV